MMYFHLLQMTNLYSEMNTEEIKCDEIDEDDETCATVDRDTMFDDVDPYPKELIFAPGEGKKPISLFTNKDIEYLAFPTVFCGERHKQRRCYCSLQ